MAVCKDGDGFVVVGCGDRRRLEARVVELEVERDELRDELREANRRAAAVSARVVALEAELDAAIARELEAREDALEDRQRLEAVEGLADELVGLVVATVGARVASYVDEAAARLEVAERLRRVSA